MRNCGSSEALETRDNRILFHSDVADVNKNRLITNCRRQKRFFNLRVQRGAFQNLLNAIH